MTFLRRRISRQRHDPVNGSGVRTPKQRAGDAAEDAACAHLRDQGCRIIARNTRFREGELDIVAQHGSTLVFVEVRLRGSDRFGGAAGSVDQFKRRRLVRAAQHYLQQHYGNAPRNAVPPCRFDVVTANESGVTEWLQGAFGADD